MKCPFCHDIENRVIDSRLTKDGGVIRRRRECSQCRRRFTTYERVEEVLPLVVKKDSRREVFDRMKIVAGMTKACEKRPVSAAAIEAAADRVERLIQDRGEKEVPSSILGEAIMRELHSLDQVAYVRFASVYRSFQDVGEFMRELQDLIKDRQKTKPATPRGAVRRQSKPAR
ncbi:MAG: transcriptional regulator NrdR [Acidobacteria bacterium RBG_16_68_9]|nr:MAG: transcriptional regulator NrdR [Acidobacteria bacterium RBG_16_68_9]